MRQLFINTYKPVMDDALTRTFGTMAGNRLWCEQNLSKWLSCGRV